MGCCHQQETALPPGTPAPHSCPECGFEAFVRNHFFTGKMMGTAEFMAETHFHAEKLRHHNLRLHGWGVVCGLKVRQHPSPDCRTRYVVVEPGSALDCCGHEILVPHEEIVDIAGLPQVRQLARDTLAHALQVCVRWRECPTEEVPVLYDECGCDDTRCAPNRILESYEFDVLVDPVLSLAELIGQPALGAFVDSDLHGITGAIGAAAGKVALVDPSNAKRLFILDPAHRSMQTVLLAAEARALALSADGANAMVVTTTTDGTPTCEVHVYAVATATEVAPIGATPRKIPGTSAASRLRAVAGDAGGTATLAVLDIDGGQLYRWKVDATHAIADSPTAPALAVATGMSAFAGDGDTRGYALDGKKIVAIDLAANTRADLFTFTTPTPSAVAAFKKGATPMLAVAGLDGGNSTLYLIDPAAPNANTTVPLAFDPLYVAAAGDWLQVFEDDNGHNVIQAVNIASIGTATPVVTAPRLTGGGTREIVLLFGAGQAGAMTTSQLADSDCADHLWHQLEGCPTCDMPNCVVLATLSNYRPGAEMLDPGQAPSDLSKTPAIIDNRTGRRMLASTATLQAWLECLQLKGGIPGPAGPPGPATNGDPGKDGVGLDVDLPKIIDIGWRHREELPLLQFLQRLMSLDAAGKPITPGALVAAVQAGVANGVPLLTVYFNRPMVGIDRQTFRVRVDFPAIVPAANNQFAFSGVYSIFGHEIYGELVDVPGPVPLPHITGGSTAAYAAVFVPRPEYLQVALPGLVGLMFAASQQNEKLDKPTVTITLKGEFIHGLDGANYSQKLVLDGDNIGGRVGLDETRGGIIKGGKNPSGNLTQGGRFESWITLNLRGDAVIDHNIPPIGAAAQPDPAAPGRGGGSPLLVNFSSREALAAIPGVSAALARRIAAARTEKPFSAVADLRDRARLNDREWELLRDHLLVI